MQDRRRKSSLTTSVALLVTGRGYLLARFFHELSAVAHNCPLCPRQPSHPYLYFLREHDRLIVSHCPITYPLWPFDAELTPLRC